MSREGRPDQRNEGKQSVIDKLVEYAALVSDRKACHRCSGLFNPSEVEHGSLDSNQIGPWSLWQGNLEAALMVVGQDWGDVAYFPKNRGRGLARSGTNRALVELLAVAGGCRRSLIAEAIITMMNCSVMGNIRGYPACSGQRFQAADLRDFVEESRR